MVKLREKGRYLVLQFGTWNFETQAQHWSTKLFDAQEEFVDTSGKKGRGLFQKMAQLMQLLVAFLLYCYVLVVIVKHHVV